MNKKRKSNNSKYYENVHKGEMVMFFRNRLDGAYHSDKGLQAHDGQLKPRFRQYLSDFNNNECSYCGYYGKNRNGRNGRDNLYVVYLKPRQDKGRGYKKNLVITCPNCYWVHHMNKHDRSAV